MGGAVCVPPPLGHGRGAPRDGGSLYLGPSLCLPWAGIKGGGIDIALLMECMVSIPFWLMSAC